MAKDSQKMTGLLLHRRHSSKEPYRRTLRPYYFPVLCCLCFCFVWGDVLLRFETLFAGMQFIGPDPDAGLV